MRCYRKAVSLVALLAFAVPLAWSQERQDRDQGEITTFSSNVNVVSLFFNVKDKKGTLMTDLAKDDFQVLEDGKPQTVKYFSKESDQPLTLGILIDSSASQTRVLDMEKEAGAAFLSQVLKPKDLAFVISLDVNVDLLQNYTNDARLLQAALNRATINSGGAGGAVQAMSVGPFPPASTHGTLLYDAIYIASLEKLSKEVGRKAMIVLTDGEDQGSMKNIKDAIEAAQKADAICYVILIADNGFYAPGGYRGAKAMHKLAVETGGRVIEASNSMNQLRTAFEQIAAEMRTQYNIGYTPSNSKFDGTFRKVEIDKRGYKVQARHGYYAMPSNAAN